MQCRGPIKIKSLLDQAPRSTLRMYSVLNNLTDKNIEVYLHHSAILVIDYSTIMFWAKKTEDLIPLFKYIPTERPLDLFCIEYRFIPLLKKHFENLEITDDCHIWILEKPPLDPPHLDSLTVEDAPYINEHWEFKDEESIYYITECLSMRPSSCVRDTEGTPIAWAFSYEESPYHIHMGALYVMKAHRCQGLGRQITLDLSTKVFNRGKKPIVHIRVENLISQHLTQKVGFEKKERIIYGKLYPKKQKK